MSESKTLISVPAHVQQRIAASKQGGTRSAILGALAGGLMPPRISIRASRFRLVENQVETTVGVELDVILVGSNPNTSKLFYAKPFDGDLAVQPDCQSSNGRHPDASVSSPVCDSCAKCPNNVLGSHTTPNGKASKKCGDYRYLAVVPAADPTKVYTLSVPVTGMKGLRTYANELSNFGVEPYYLVTRLSFDEEASYPLVVFNRGQWLSEKAINTVEKLITERQEDIKICTREAEAAGALPAPDAKPALEATKAAPEPTVAPVSSKPAAPKPAPVSSKPAAPKPVPTVQTEFTFDAPEAAQESLDNDGIDAASADLEAQLDKLLG